MYQALFVTFRTLVSKTKNLTFEELPQSGGKTVNNRHNK